MFLFHVAMFITALHGFTTCFCLGLGGSVEFEAALVPPCPGGSVSAGLKGSDCNLDQHILAPS